MTDRTVTDSAGRTWTCTTELDGTDETSQGRDVVLACATPSVSEPVRLTVGWQWESMAATGLARLIAQASPVPRR
ncbi:MAG TPA: hypothetical protein VEA99_21210 [Gemmatimonadaceae bacterium]|nr:hypothetical protein [Gemmatimonadaceae bacterium]